MSAASVAFSLSIWTRLRLSDAFRRRRLDRSSPTVARTSGAALVYILQPSLQHYRLPVWDLLVEAGHGRYDFHAFGEMSAGQAFGGGTRSYLHPLREQRVRVPFLQLLRWPEASSLIERDRPEVVVVAANPRNLTCWRLRRVCRRVGTTCVAHAKVDSFTGLPDWAVDRLKRRFFLGFDELVCYGNHARTKAVELGFPVERLSVARNTIDTRRIFTEAGQLRLRAAALRETAPTDRILLFIGRLEADKRADDLLDAWPLLRGAHENLCLVVVGGGPDLERLRTRAAEIDSSRIVVTGRVADGDDYAWIGAADVCVFPGAVGLALNQSLALAVPTVIADETTSDAELVEHGVTGWRYPRGDIDALVAAVDHVLDPDARDEVHEVSERSRRLMRDEVTIEQMVTVFDAIIKRNLPSAPPPDPGRRAA